MQLVEDRLNVRVSLQQQLVAIFETNCSFAAKMLGSK
jgi:hypothetical protein